ncbi:hypothetical protein M0R45_009433 [Rubus argutus]|uniref:NB-ARC domain-containing protein n=1 Tax=Rubus argutus TaxID=59490 RepID=A0AAW1Y408_RUBAR
MGRVGKTTLVGEVVNRAKREGVFDEYAKAVVTETPDLSKIQCDVAEYISRFATYRTGFSVLVTSRIEGVFNEMEETRKNFPIGVLPENDAWSLFKKKAGDHIESDP